MTPKKRKATAVEKSSRVSFETFREISPYAIGNLTQGEPSCLNGDVSVRRYRVTIELIDEPIAVIADRIQSLWETSDNYRHCEPLRRAARAIGYELLGSLGSKREAARKGRGR